MYTRISELSDLGFASLFMKIEKKNVDGRSILYAKRDVVCRKKN